MHFYQEDILFDDTELAFNCDEIVRWRDYKKYVDREAIFLAQIFEKVSSKIIHFDVSNNYFLTEVMLLLEHAMILKKNNLQRREYARIKNGNN